MFFCRRHIDSRRFYSPAGGTAPYFVGAKYCSPRCAKEARVLSKEVENALQRDAERLKLIAGIFEFANSKNARHRLP